jgi:hypothetical protein
MENTQNTVITSADEEVKVTTLADLDGWTERVESLNAFISDMGKKEVRSFIREGVSKSGKAQALAVLLHCSSGYVGDKFRDKSEDESVEVLKTMIAPALTPEQIKARSLATAKATIETLKAQNVAVETIRLCVGAMPEGKNALKELGI